MLQERYHLIHPILFSLYPILFVLSRNITQITPWDLVSPLITLGLLGVSIFFLGKVLMRDGRKSALLTSFSMFVLTSFQHFYYTLTNTTGWNTLSQSYLLLIWLCFYLGGCCIIYFGTRLIPIATRCTNIFGMMLLVLIGVSLLRGFFSHQNLEAKEATEVMGHEWVENWVQTRQRAPDIYYIILDGYGRADKLKKIYEVDNQAFVDTLETLGFVALDRSTSNYADTQHSIRSSLNMNYKGEDGYSIGYNKVALLMRALGYQYNFIPSGYYLTASSPIADVSIKLGVSTQSELSALLLEYSVFGHFLRSSRSLTQMAIVKGVFENVRGTRQWYEQITRSIEAVGKIPEMEQPTFTFAHIISPHPPYVFRRDGTLREESTMSEIGNFNNYNWWSESLLFKDQITHLNRLLESLMIELLTKSVEPPIIILQGDHGTLALSGKELNTQNVSADAIRERMSILLALHVPEVIREKVYGSLTPVNIFRIIFNQYFGSEYPLLPDKNFWSLSRPMKDVTNIVRDEYLHFGHF